MDHKNTNAPDTTVTYDKSKVEEATGNIYEAISIIAKRTDQINGDLKKRAC